MNELLKVGLLKVNAKSIISFNVFFLYYSLLEDNIQLQALRKNVIVCLLLFGSVL